VGLAVSREDPVTGGQSSRKSVFVNVDSQREAAPLLTPDTAVVEISDSSEGSFDQEMISKLLAEQEKSDDDDP
jgi:hypothetical protein